jgi:hypothetical protein
MRLIDDDILERKLLECTFFDETNLVRCDANLEVLRDKPSCYDLATFFFGASENNDVDVWGPSLEFAGPVLQGGFGDDDEMWTGSGSMMFEIGEE